MDEILKEKYKVLSNLIFGDISKTVDDLEVKYPKRNLEEGTLVTRFAPSPTGFLHTGALFTSLVNKKIADQSNGVFILRIEDTDKKREVEGSKKLLAEQMHEFRIDPEEGVISENEEIGNYGPYVQSNRGEIYKICAKHLLEKGLAYPCFCTTEMLNIVHEKQEQQKIIPGYYGIYARCRNISIDEMIDRVKSGEKYIIRFRSQGSHMKKMSYIDAIRGKIEMAENDQDIVIIKSDGLPTYHFAHIVDDHFMRITNVIRSEEWIASVPIHLELFKAMDFVPPIYAHVPAVLTQDGASKRKLSKRKDKEAAASFFVSSGYEVDAVREYLLNIINSDFEPWKMKNPLVNVDDFQVKLEKMNSAGALFDIVKLNDVSKELIAKMYSKEILEKVLVWSKVYDEELYELLNNDLDYALKIFALERDDTKKVRKDIYKWEDIKPTFFYFFKKLYEKDIKEKGYEFDFLIDSSNFKISREKVIEILKAYATNYNENFTKEEWFDNLKELANKFSFCTDMKLYKQEPDKYIGSTADFAALIRIAMTNRKNSPDIYSVMQILQKDEVINRINNIIENI